MVDERMKGDKLVRKFASAHDCRRAFGFRWAMKVMPTVLQRLMRYEDIGTTMLFDAGRNAEAVADADWLAVGNTMGNTAEQATNRKAEKALNSSGDDRS